MSKKQTGSSRGGVAADQLRAFVERIERLNEEKETINDDTKVVFAEAKSMGFDTKALRRVIALRKLDQHQRAEFEAVVDTYLDALGMSTGGLLDPARLEATRQEEN